MSLNLEFNCKSINTNKKKNTEENLGFGVIEKYLGNVKIDENTLSLQLLLSCPCWIWTVINDSIHDFKTHFL